MLHLKATVIGVATAVLAAVVAFRVVSAQQPAQKSSSENVITVRGCVEGRVVTRSDDDQLGCVYVGGGTSTAPAANTASRPEISVRAVTHVADKCSV